MVPFLFLPLLVVCSFGPGFFLVRRVRRLTVDERLSASIALSLLLIYLLAGLIYVLGISWRWSWLGTAIVAGMTLWSVGDLRHFLGRRQARRLLAAFGMLIVLGLLLQVLVQHYSGGAWAGDWLEHYDRTLFFLQRQALDTEFITIYKLPARPPMMQLISAYLMGHFGPAGAGFDSFQVISLFLNALVFFPCVLLAGMLVKGGNRKVWMIVAFLAVSPVFIQNITWTWNKLMAGFFVILSVALYVRGWRRQSSGRIVASSASMACGILVHYSAVPFAAFLFVHYACILAWRKRKSFEVVASFATVIAIVATWFGWAIWNYGPQTTFLSNTTVTGSLDRSLGENLLVRASNFYSSIVPFPLSTGWRSFSNHLDQPNLFGKVRDFYFLLCQQNLPGSFGMLGWIGAGYLAIRALFWGRADRSVRVFWGGFVVFTAILGIAVVGEDNFFGVAHACLQSLTLIGITLLATSIGTFPRWGRVAMIFSMAVDVVLGIILQFRMQMLSIRSVSIGINKDVVPISPGLLNVQGVSTSSMRFKLGMTHLADHFASVDGLILALVIVTFGLLLHAMARAILSRRGSVSSRFLPIAIVLFYAVGAMACIQDRRAGFTVSQTLPIPVAPRAEVSRQLLDPLEQRVRAEPESARAHFELGRMRYYLGDFSAAWPEVYKALLLDPYDREIHYLTSMFWLAYHFGLDDGDEGIFILYYDTYRDTIDSQLQYIAALVEAGFRGKASEIALDAVRRYPDSARTHHALGALLFRGGHPVEAQVELERSLQLDPRATDVAEHLRAVMESRGIDPSVIDKRINDLRAATTRP